MAFFTARDRSAEMKLEDKSAVPSGSPRSGCERRTSSPHRTPQEPDPARGNPVSLLRRMGEATLKEVDDLIVELQTQREKLLTESARVQCEITKFAKMSQSTMHSTKIIAESLTCWNRIADAPAAKSSIESTDEKKEYRTEGRSFLEPGEDTGARQLTQANDVPDNLTEDSAPIESAEVTIELLQ
jgi:hypothetical protein